MSIHSLIQRRGILATTLMDSERIMDLIAGSPYLMRKMTKVHSMEGHGGCVNTVHWSEDAEHILTGSGT
jgi:hypothetical protein